jgi:chromosomal replication initiation ATPase DnaA
VNGWGPPPAPPPPPEPEPEPTPALPASATQRITRVVCQHFGVSREMLLSPRRNQMFVLPRAAAYYLLQELSGASYCAIGRAFNRDHSTVLHSIEKMRKRIADSLTMRMMIEELRAKVEEENNRWNG